MSAAKVLAFLDDEIAKIDADATLRSLARTPDGFAGVLAFDSTDQTPTVWMHAPACENK